MTSLRMRTPVDLRLAPGALGTWIVCLLALKTSYAPLALGVVGALAIGAGVWPRRRGKHRLPWRGWLSLTLLIGCLTTVAAGAVASAQVTHRAQQGESVREFHSAATRIHVRLTSEVAPGAAGLGVHGIITTLADPHRQLAVRVPVYVIGADPQWRVGAIVIVSGSLSQGDDHRFFLRNSHTHTATSPRGTMRLVDQLRSGVREASGHLPPHARGLIPGVSIGDDRRLPSHLAEAMRTTSLTHITAVSGAHVAVVVGTVLAVLARVPVKARAAGAGLVLAGMILVVLPTPSVMRAGGMGLLTLFALGSKRPRLALPALFCTITALLATDPWLATSIGFGLSVSATLGILISAGPFAEALGSSALGRIVSVPLAAQIWCSPLLLTFDASLATYSVPANMLAVPALAPATILGLTSALLSQISPAAAALAATAGSYFTGWIAVIATFFAGLPGAKLPWMSGSMGVVAFLTAAVALTWVLRYVRRSRTWQT